MQAHSHFIFVYGSLLSGFKSPAYEYMSRYFELKSTGTVKGAIYDMGTFPVGVPVDIGRQIKGELYEIKNPKELSFALAQLDDYEGLNPDEGEEVYYSRMLTEVTTDEGNIVNAWAYWYIKSVDGKPVINSDNMIDYLKHK